jgi:catechol 2,3-dioxygenase-like lactoylglutathione lyase family enzyme
MADVPSLYRVTIHVSDLEGAAAFYEKLLGANGRRIHGARHYLDCGPVILALLDPTEGGVTPKPLPDYVYFAVKGIEKVHARARELGCLATDDVHGESAGAIVERPWGERSFYATDPYGNGLCFVDARTVFTGRRAPARPSRRPKARPARRPRARSHRSSPPERRSPGVS